MNRRVFGLGMLGTASVALAGCTSEPRRPVNPDGTYCFRANYKSRFKTCTPEPVPTAAVEAEVKRFESVPGALTLYVLRKRWADDANQVVVSLDGRARVTTIPESLFRVRLKPAEHRLAIEWNGRSVELTISGAAGEVRFVELVASVWTLSADYRWEAGTPDASQSRAAAAKLIADVDLRD